MRTIYIIANLQEHLFFSDLPTKLPNFCGSLMSKSIKLWWLWYACYLNRGNYSHISRKIHFLKRKIFRLNDHSWYFQSKCTLTFELWNDRDCFLTFQPQSKWLLFHSLMLFSQTRILETLCNTAQAHITITPWERERQRESLSRRYPTL